MAEETRCLRWLHLSDLHVGARGEAAWWTVLDDLWRSLDEWLPRRGPPHAVLLTGDLASSGLPGEYDRLDRFLDRLLARLGRPEPTLVAVPGNHDVRRPKDPLALTGLRWLREYEADDDAIRDVRRLLWERRKAEAVPPLFEAWQAWAGRRLRPTHASFFPGDTTTVLEGDGGLTVGVVGLNSAWTQYTGGSFERLLQLEAEQLLAALPEPEAGGSPLDLFERCDRALLLLHHPPAWLSKRAERILRELVYPPTRFDLCLYGHLHRARSELTSVGGGRPRAWFQAPSLFGMEGYGTPGESRAMGYAWGELLGDGEVRVWPLDRVLRADGSGAFDVDTSFAREPEGYVQLRPPEAATAPRTPEVAGGDEAGVADYRRWARERHGRLELIGINAGELTLELTDVYVPLRLAEAGWEHGPHGMGDEEAGLGAEARAAGHEDLELEEAFSRAGPGQDLVLLGQPGAGKTTALRKLLHAVLGAGAESVGLEPGTLPLFLRLRHLGEDLLGGEPWGFVQRELDAWAPGRFPAPFAQELWGRGRLLLLLDGLDEVAREADRVAVCRALERWLPEARGRGVRSALSCRHAGWGGEATLDEAFLRLDVRPLDGGRVNDLVRLWFSAARRALAVHPDERVAAERRAAREAQALIDRLGEPDQAAQRLLALVSVPLLLTLLCLVVLRGGEIPRRRSKFYEQCLEVLLGRWRESRGIRPLLPVEDALDLLRPVAYQLHEAGRRDDLTAAEFSEWTGELTEAIGRAAGRELTPARVLDWLHVGAGVLAEYAPDRYGFSHLGFQEYLAALHVGREGGGLPGELAGHFGEEWWREVMLLLLGQPTYPVFGRFARHLAGRPVEEHPELLRRCLDEAHRPEAGAFAAALRGRKVPNRRKAALLRAFVGRQEPAVEAAAEGLVDSRDADVRALACQLLGREPTPLPAAAAAEAVREEPWTEPETGIRFLWVPGGEYEMGGKAVTKASLPAHRVRVSPFWLAETPVTNGQYGSFLEATGHAEPEYWRDGRFSDATQPVVGVSWADAEAFCAWLADLAGRPVGLPSEAQWERAARGEDGRRYPWGDGEPDAARACFAGSSKGRPDPVGTHPAGRGPFGHLDLAGNVWEWCADVWDAEAYRRRAGKEPELNPVVTQGDEARRALRGGSWDNAAAGLHAACRGGDHAGARWRYCGFRVSSSPASTVD